MKVHRTPDARFAALPDYPYEPNYLTLSSGLRMHYVAAILDTAKKAGR